MNNGTEPISRIINDNEKRFNKPSLNNDIDDEEAKKVADWLVEKLGYGLDSRNYYFRVAKKLPRQTLERLADTALEVGRHPGRLFTYLTKKEIQDREARNED